MARTRFGWQDVLDVADTCLYAAKHARPQIAASEVLCRRVPRSRNAHPTNPPVSGGCRRLGEVDAGRGWGFGSDRGVEVIKRRSDSPVRPLVPVGLESPTYVVIRLRLIPTQPSLPPARCSPATPRHDARPDTSTSRKCRWRFCPRSSTCGRILGRVAADELRMHGPR